MCLRLRHLAGQTLHSFAGIGIGCSTLAAALKKASELRRKGKCAFNPIS